MEKYLYYKIKIIGLIILTFVLSQLPSLITYIIHIPQSVFYWIFPLITIIDLLVVITIARKNKAFLGFKQSFRGKNLFIIFSLAFLGIALSLLSFQIYQKLGYRYSSPNQESVNQLLSYLPSWYILFGPSIQAPIFEELTFREYLYRLFKTPLYAFIASALVFAFAHSGFNLSIIIYLPTSLIFAFAYHYRKSVTDSILVHGIYNFLNFIIPLLIR